MDDYKEPQILKTVMQIETKSGGFEVGARGILDYENDNNNIYGKSGLYVTTMI